MAGSVTVTGPTPVGATNKFEQLTFDCVGDASAGTVPDTTFPKMGLLKGKKIKSIETIPGSGAAEPSAYTVAINNARGLAVYSLDARAVDANEIDVATTDIIIDSALTLVVGDLGNSDTTQIIVTIETP